MYPADKETFRRVVNRDLSGGIPGTTLDKDDQNLPADFLERLQDTLGLEVNGEYASVAERLNTIPNLGNLSGIWFGQGDSFTASGGISDDNSILQTSIIPAGNKLIMIYSFKFRGAGITATMNIEPRMEQGTGIWYQVEGGIELVNTNPTTIRQATRLTKAINVTAPRAYNLGIKGVSGYSNTTIYDPNILALAFTQ